MKMCCGTTTCKSKYSGNSHETILPIRYQVAAPFFLNSFYEHMADAGVALHRVAQTTSKYIDQYIGF